MREALWSAQMIVACIANLKNAAVIPAATRAIRPSVLPRAPPDANGCVVSADAGVRLTCRRRQDAMSAIRIVAALLAGVALAGCASLPHLQDVEDAAAARPATPLRIVGPDGLLMPEYRAELERRLKGGSSDGLLGRQLEVMQAVTDGSLVAGNATTILVDGPQAYMAMLAAIEGARDHVHIESFIFEDLDFGQRLGDLLVAKQAAGVAISVLYDSFGSIATPRAFFDRLRGAGVHVCEFNPLNPLRATVAWRLNHRDHRKIVVVDGMAAFTGGINFHRVYRTGSAGLLRRSMPTIDEGWRDTHLAIRGPAVSEFQRLFITSWDKQRCEPLPAREFFPPLGAEGDTVVSVIGSSPDSMENRMYLTLVSALTRAQRSIYLTTAYFAPDPNTIAALTGAAARGVDVRLLLPGITDSWLVLHAGRSHYATLLAGGVRIYERHDVLLHAKTAVIDGVWSTIGSSNTDWRSFGQNDEVNAVVLGEPFGVQMTRLFFDDLAAAREIEREAWEARGAQARLREWFARRWEHLL